MAQSIIILAAGFGTRMKSKKPKVLHDISGKPMIFHVLDAAQKLSDDITVVLYFEHEMIREAIEHCYEGIRFKIQDVENYPGTGGALRDIETVHEEVMILNGDMPLVSEEALAPLMEVKADIAMTVLKLDDPGGYGRVAIKEGSVEKIIEQKDCSKEQLAIDTVNAGMYKVSKTILQEYIPRLSNDNAGHEYYLTDIVEMGVREGKSVKPAYVQERYFKGVNSKYDLAKAEEMMQDEIKKRWMQEGIIMKLPATIYVDCRAQLRGECVLESGTTILGHSILENAHVKANSVIEDAELFNSCAGPMARIRPKSILKNSHVGNFVEVKNSTLTGVKAGHLSYMGDSTIDEGSNIGAGVITCNYDGKSKHQTLIGKNVFVGSDCQLVAPVTIEDDAIIAAGTTLTKDVKKGELAISRAPLKRVADFFYKFFKN